MPNENAITSASGNVAQSAERIQNRKGHCCAGCQWPIATAETVWVKMVGNELCRANLLYLNSFSVQDAKLMGGVIIARVQRSERVKKTRRRDRGRLDLESASIPSRARGSPPGGQA